MADNNSPSWSGAPAFIANKWCFKTFLELSVDVTIGLWHIEFADPSVMVYEDVGFGFDVSDGSASLIASVASQQALIHACQFWCIVLRRQFQVRILACTCGVIQGLHFLLGLDLPMWVVSVEMRMSMKRETWRGKLASSGRLFIFDFWTSFVKQDQSMLFRCHQAVLGTTAGNRFYD